MSAIRWSIVLGLLAASCSGSSSSHRQGGVPATETGGVYTCPPGAGFIAYGAVFYPPNYPSPPRSTKRPSRCFASRGQAAASGYRLAKPPPGATVVAGVYLVRPRASLASLCKRSAKKAGIPIPCPTLIPGKADAVFCAGVFPCAVKGAFVLEGSFSGPASYVGADPGDGHLFIIAYGPRSGIWPRDTLAGGKPVGTTTVRGHPGRFITSRAGSGLNAGHVALTWRKDGTTYAVTLHGDTGLNRRLDLLIADHLALVS